MFERDCFKPIIEAKLIQEEQKNLAGKKDDFLRVENIEENKAIVNKDLETNIIRVLEIMDGLVSQTPIEVAKEVIEGGKKMVLTADWPGTTVKNHFLVSITESSLSFIRNSSTNNYHRLEGEDIGDSQQVENSILAMFNDPSKL